nr:hypothetical protein [Tanacetum cinerariifolium]
THLYSLIMTSLFAESHNMVAILENSDAAQGFEQIIDFLSGSYIHHALTVNPEVLDKCSALVLRVEGLETANAAQQLEIIKLKAMVKKLERLNKVAAASTPIPAAKPKVLKIAAALAVSTRRRKGVEYEEAYKQIDWNAAFNHVQAKETQYIKRYHGFKKKPQSESEARKNMISYLKNTEGYKMEFFKGK